MSESGERTDKAGLCEAQKAKLCEREANPRQPRLSLHKKRVPMRTLFLWKKDKEAKKPKQKWTESTHTKASLTSALGEE